MADFAHFLLNEQTRLAFNDQSAVVYFLSYNDTCMQMYKTVMSFQHDYKSLLSGQDELCGLEIRTDPAQSD